jgi:hypothetical protein
VFSSCNNKGHLSLKGGCWGYWILKFSAHYSVPFENPGICINTSLCYYLANGRDEARARRAPRSLVKFLAPSRPQSFSLRVSLS